MERFGAFGFLRGDDWLENRSKSKRDTWVPGPEGHTKSWIRTGLPGVPTWLDARISGPCLGSEVTGVGDSCFKLLALLWEEADR